jgi:cytochrome c-type biogenesis protein CcsB
MNNILKYKGYRFFQSSYDKDEKGTILSVNHDQLGTSITYFGYLIMALGMILTLFNRNSRFKKLVKASAKLHAERKKFFTVFFIGLILSFSSPAQSDIQNNRIDKSHVASFSELLIQNNRGRIEPVNTLASEILRKVAKTSNFLGIPASEVFLDMHINPQKWKNIPVIKVSNPELRTFLGATDKLVSFNSIVGTQQSGGYKLSAMVQAAYEKKPADRNKLDKEIINVDERVNILMNVFSNNFLTIFPVPGDVNNKWVSLNKISILGAEKANWAQTSISNYFASIQESKSSGEWRSPNGYLKILKENQENNGAKIIPPKTKIKLEIFYNNFNIFSNLAKTYILIGLILLAFQFITIFNPKIKTRKLIKIGIVIAAFLFTTHSAGLAIRWYISGHAPWSNGYESMIFISWATCLAGLIFIKRSEITLSLTLALAGLSLMVAGMSWMSPEITDLVPVLKSYWLIVHVAIITASYGFLGICALLGLLNLILMIFRTEKNIDRINITIKELVFIIQMALIIGLFMLTVGSFIGGVWANESWGRYWGWDPKETWALVTILVYSFITHMHKIPGFRGSFAHSTAALVGFGSVLMTYFGVNYYLSGLHSYAQGEPAPIPLGVYISAFLVLVIIVSAYISERFIKNNSKTKNIKTEIEEI